MADALFDYETLVITLPTGETEIQVERDLYSAWKRSQLAEDDPETGAYPAFRTTGGDPLTPGIDAGSYFFIRNDLGWRIRPAEEDATVLFSGNLAPEDSTLDILIPTIGNYSVLINGLQPITQNVDTLLVAQQTSSYANRVVIDTATGTSGTSYPVGQFSSPVDNLTDALAIMLSIGATQLVVDGSLTLDQSIPAGYTISGITGVGHDDVALAGQTVDMVAFSGLLVSGTGSGNVDMELCDLSSLAGVTGVFRQCCFLDNITLVAGSYVFSYCFSGVPGLPKPYMDYNGTNADVSNRAYSGGMELRNITDASSDSTFDCISASIELLASCTAGNVVIRGTGLVTNNSAGTTVNELGFVEGGQNFTDVLDDPNAIEAGLTVRQTLRLILAATAGKVSGAATTSMAFRNALADSKDRITATVDANGNRSAISYDVTD